MSDIISQQDDTVEPDEDVLISALRNQDDIPILMDVVSEKVAEGASQETYMAQSIEESVKAAQVDGADDVSQEVVPSEIVSQVITEVLERRLPELVAEVLSILKTKNSADK